MYGEREREREACYVLTFPTDGCAQGMSVLFGYLSLIIPLYWRGVWLGEDQRTNIIKIHV